MSDEEVGFGEGDQEQTLKKGARPRAPSVSRPRGAKLLVMGNGAVETHALPDSGTVIVGRAPAAGVRIDDPSISRKHALLHVGSTIQVEDLGSANGTLLRGTRLEPGERQEVLPGDAIEVGAWTMMIQYPSALSARPQRLWPHGYFEARLESECARAERKQSALAVLRLHAGQGVRPETVQEALASKLSSEEIAASYGPGEYEILLVEGSAERAGEIGEAILKQLRQAGAVSPRYGLAAFPRDGRTPEVLIAKACDGVRGVEPEERPAGPIVVEDPAMQQLHKLIDRVASGSISVLILGETGVGKEIIAETIHRRSPRAAKTFTRLNCAALSDTLIESELFGYEKGAFTGAERTKPGLLETAQGGTIFLDEVGELPMSTQVKLLRVLEERMVLRVGALKPRPIDVRFVSATNRNLESEIAAGRYRQDLYFRLNGITITVPPLRERTAEVASLAQLFVRQICRQDGRSYEPRISKEALRLLVGYGWPGNIRELRNLIERAVLLSGGDEILPEHLPLDKMTPAPGGAASGLLSPAPARPAAPSTSARSSTPVAAPMLAGGGGFDDGPATLLDEMQAFERDRIVEALERCGGNQTQAAKLLGIARRTLIKRLDLYAIQRPRKGLPGEED
jgi:DNA-binding NtrC family response regulator